MHHSILLCAGWRGWSTSWSGGQILLSSVMLRQNPHNVHEWHKRVKLFNGQPHKQILTYTEAVTTVDVEKVSAHV